MTTRYLWPMVALLCAVMVLSVSEVARADEHGDEQGCTVARLHGLYVFAATGYTGLPVTSSSSPAQPKAIIELIRFNGDGSLDVPGATRSINGSIAQIPAGGTGIYTVSDVVTPGGACTGTLTFSPSGPHFDLFIAPNGKHIWMIQTDSGNVFQGMTTKLSP